jgi:cytochrome P450
MNMWAPNAKEFKPERWLDGSAIQGNANTIQGYQHLLTFSDGLRMCLGRSFVLTEFKVCNYKFGASGGLW